MARWQDDSLHTRPNTSPRPDTRAHGPSTLQFSCYRPGLSHLHFAQSVPHGRLCVPAKHGLRHHWQACGRQEQAVDLRSAVKNGLLRYHIS